MLVGATGTVFPILFQSPDENAPQWQISLILNKGIKFENGKSCPKGKINRFELESQFNHAFYSSFYSTRRPKTVKIGQKSKIVDNRLSLWAKIELYVSGIFQNRYKFSCTISIWHLSVSLLGNNDYLWCWCFTLHVFW